MREIFFFIKVTEVIDDCNLDFCHIIDETIREQFPQIIQNCIHRKRKATDVKLLIIIDSFKKRTTLFLVLPIV